MEISSIAFALDPTNTPSFLLDWEVTRFCNLDCGYCTEGHDNSTRHPPLAECLQSIDFMYQYVDLYMNHKRPTQRKVVLNVYGGESLLHPDIVEILTQVRERYQPYADRWYLTVTCTTNGIVGDNLWSRIVPLVDEFTMSYHAETVPKQKDQFKRNLMYLQSVNKRFSTVVMMHNRPEYWADSETIIDFCKQHNIRHIAKPVDIINPDWSYTNEQFSKFKTIWISKSNTDSVSVNTDTDRVNSLSQGRACCGGRLLAINSDLKSRVAFVPRQDFRGWNCSVNWFFLFVRQQTGEIFTNKDCKTSTTGRVEPLGLLTDYQAVLNTLRSQLETGTLPVIQCVKPICRCGFCAPKAQDPEQFQSLMQRHVISDVFLKN